jgi:hypothetical protein
MPEILNTVTNVRLTASEPHSLVHTALPAYLAFGETKKCTDCASQRHTSTIRWNHLGF